MQGRCLCETDYLHFKFVNGQTRNMFVGVLVSLASTVLALVLAEIFLRFFYAYPYRDRPFNFFKLRRARATRASPAQIHETRATGLMGASK